MWTVLVVTLVVYVSVTNGAYGSDGTNDPPPPSCAKTCYYKHPQIVFCNVDIVAKVQILKYKKYGYDDAAYLIKVKQIIKGGPNVYSIKILYTECGASSHHPFYEGKTYLIMGRSDNRGHIVLDSCDFSISMHEMNCYQRKGIFKQEFAANCQCSKQIGFGVGDQCLYDKSSLCYSSYAYCRYSGGHCGWAKFWKFREC